MASLLSLPPEIFNAVLDGVGGRDVLNLRRVSRRVSALSTHQFGLKCLSDLSFVWSKHSLNGLLDLTVHPLGRYINRLTFETEVEDTANHLGHIGQRRDEEIFAIWQDHITILAQALANLKGLGVQPTLGIYDALVTWISSDDFNGQQERRGYGYNDYHGPARPSPHAVDFAYYLIPFILEAARQAHLPLRRFYSHYHERPYHKCSRDEFQTLRDQVVCPEPGKLNPDFEMYHNSYIPRANLNYQVHIDTKSQKFEFCTLPSPGVDWLRHPRLSFLDRDCLIIHYPRTYHCFREIRLALCDTAVDFLVDFLRSQADTLRVLHLEYVTINLYDDEEDAEDDTANPNDTSLNFLLMLKDDLKLQYLRLNRVSNTRDQSRLIGGHDDTWVGREEIRDGLQMYIQREEDGEHSVDEELSDDEGEWISVHHSEGEDEETEEGWSV